VNMTTPAPQPQDRPSLGDLAGGTSRRRACPRCGEREFSVTNVWHLKDGRRRRSFHCRRCGYVDNSVEEYDSGREPDDST